MTCDHSVQDLSLLPIEWETQAPHEHHESPHPQRADSTGSRGAAAGFVVTEVDAYMRMMLHGVCQFHDLSAATVTHKGQRCVRIAHARAHGSASFAASDEDTVTATLTALLMAMHDPQQQQQRKGPSRRQRRTRNPQHQQQAMMS